MTTPGEPIGLPALVALLYRADWTRLSLSAAVHARHDLTLRSRMPDVQATGEPLPGLLGRWLRSAASSPEPGPDVVTRGSVLVAPGSRYRLELTDEDGSGLTVSDGASHWEVSGGVATREAASDPPDPLGDLLIPSRLLTAFSLELIGTSVVGGRAAYRVVATPRSALAGNGVIRKRHPDQVLAVVDAELGILVSYQEVFDGQQLRITELTDLVPDPPAAAEAGQFRPPAGLPAQEGARPRLRLAERDIAIPGLAGQAARRLGGAAATAMSFVVRHLPPGTPGPSAPAGDGPGSPGPRPATDAAQLRPVTDDVVNLLYRTGLAPPVFTAVVDEWTEGAAVTRMGAAVRASLPPVLAGVLGPDQLWDALGDRFPARVHRISRLTVAMPGRYRIDHLAGAQGHEPSAIACDGERLWRVYPDRVAKGPPWPLDPDFARLADQSCLLSGCQLTVAGEAEVDGRRGFLVVADGVDKLRGPGRGGLFPDSLTTHVEVVVDAELGIALRETAYFEGKPARSVELRDVSLEADPGAFRVEIPAGTRTVRAGLLSDLDMPAPVKAARLAIGVGVAGGAALIGWLQQRPAGDKRRPAGPEGPAEGH
jgi:outer membrane lipoprotein-sorting protein